VLLLRLMGRRGADTGSDDCSCRPCAAVYVRLMQLLLLLLLYCRVDVSVVMMMMMMMMLVTRVHVLLCQSDSYFGHIKH